MAIPTNTSALTATDLGTLPASVSQDVHDSGTTYTVWYKYTATASDVLVGVFGSGVFGGGGYRPELRVYQEPAAAPVYLGIGGVNIPVQVPVVAGTTYFFEFNDPYGDPSPAILNLEVESLTLDATPAGTIVVNDDTEGFPLIFLSGVDGDDYHVVSAIYPFPAGEAGDILPSGVSLWSDAWEYNLRMFDANFDDVATIAMDIGFSISIRGNRGNNLFYVCDFAGSWTWTLKAFNETGTTVDTWTLSPGTGVDIDGIAASNDGTILYHASMGSSSPIRRWDLVNDVALTNLAAAVSTDGVIDLLVLDDDSIIACYVSFSSNCTVRRYDASGTVLNTYDFGAISQPAGTPPRLAYAAATSPRSFWIWTHHLTGISRFRHIQASDGTVLAEIDSVEYEGGEYEGTPTASPLGRFGNSFSCPFVILPGEAPGVDYVIEVPTGALVLQGYAPTYRTLDDIVTYPSVMRRIRRVRRAALRSPEGAWLFYQRFQLDLESGMGLDSGQGSDPQVMLRWSDDAGHTWGHDHWASAGPVGQYGRRAIWRRLGRSRHRVCEVVISDPVKVAWVGAWIDVAPGVH